MKYITNQIKNAEDSASGDGAAAAYGRENLLHFYFERRLTMKVKIEWTNNKEDFVAGALGGEWFITNDDILITGSQLENDKKYSRNQIKHSLIVLGLAAHHTTDWLRFYCNEHHPEIDFDKEFETDKPGVFARYQEKFGHDYDEDVAEMQYAALKEKLLKIGYEFPWDD